LAASALDATAHLIVLLGGEAGLRCGEMIALEWRDVDLGKRQICLQRSDWNGQVTTPKGGRLRYVPLTNRLAAAFRDHRHLRSPNVLCQDDGQSLPGRWCRPRTARITPSEAVAGRRTHPAAHVLFAPGDARRTAKSDSGARWTPGIGHDAAATCT
jgi:integrase